MKTISTLASLLISVCLGLPAGAAQDPAQFRLEPETLRKLETAHAEIKQVTKRDENEGEDGDADVEDDRKDARGKTARKDETPEGIARKIDADPKLKALLQKHGISSMEYAMSVHAMLHAGMFLMFEQSMTKEKAKELFDGYTGAQQANIDLLRKSATLKR